MLQEKNSLKPALFQTKLAIMAKLLKVEALIIKMPI